MLAHNLASDVSTTLDARRPLEPADILTRIQWVMDAADAVVTDGKIATYNGPVQITQATAAQRATYIASDPDFGGQPSANFIADATGNVDWNEYPFAGAAGWTEGEAFLVLKSTLGNAAAGNQSGLWAVFNNSHYPTGGTIFDSFLSNTRFQFPDSAAYNLTVPHVYNTWNSSAGLRAAINGTPIFTSVSNTFLNTYMAKFGSNYSNIRFHGKLAYLVICDRVQSAEARAAFIAYLRARFGIA